MSYTLLPAYLNGSCKDASNGQKGEKILELHLGGGWDREKTVDRPTCWRGRTVFYTIEFQSPLV